MDKRAKAKRAESLLADEVLQEAFDVVSEYHTSVFKRVSATEAEVLEARRRLMSLNEVKGQLRSFVGTGKLLAKKDQDRVND